MARRGTRRRQGRQARPPHPARPITETDAPAQAATRWCNSTSCGASLPRQLEVHRDRLEKLDPVRRGGSRVRSTPSWSGACSRSATPNGMKPKMTPKDHRGGARRYHDQGVIVVSTDSEVIDDLADLDRARRVPAPRQAAKAGDDGTRLHAMEEPPAPRVYGNFNVLFVRNRSHVVQQRRHALALPCAEYAEPAPEGAGHVRAGSRLRARPRWTTSPSNSSRWRDDLSLFGTHGCTTSSTPAWTCTPTSARNWRTRYSPSSATWRGHSASPTIRRSCTSTSST